MKIHRLILSLLLLICVSLSSAFAGKYYSFKHLSTIDGLSHNQINNIFKDSDGFLWFSTSGGLNRFDGYQFKIFRHDDNDKYSITDNFTDNIQEDVQGNLWIHTSSSYILFDRYKEKFYSDVLSYLHIPEGKLPSCPSVVYIDKKKKILLVQNTKVYLYKPETGKIVVFYLRNRQVAKDKITAIAEDHSSYLFLHNNGLIDRMNKKTCLMERSLNHIPAHGCMSSIKFNMYVDSKDNIWVFTSDYQGLWEYASSMNHWCKWGRQSENKLSSNVVQDVKEDKKGNIWIATDHGGINIVDNRNHCLVVKNNPSYERSLSSNSVKCLYNDDLNTMWVGTYNRGISYYNESLFKFSLDLLTEYSNMENFVPDVTFFKEGIHKDLWIGTNGSGLIHNDSVCNQSKIFRHEDKDPSSLSSNIIVSLCVTRDGKLWIGTYLGGMDCYDGHRFIHYRHDPKNSNSLVYDNVWSIVEDKRGLIWIGTLGDGLQCFNPKTKQFTTYAKPLNDLTITTNLCLGKNDKLYITTYNGLTVLDLKTMKFNLLSGNRKGTISFANLQIQMIDEDSRGLLWMATRNGLLVYDQKTDIVYKFNSTNGLPNDYVCSIVEDNDKNMWVTTCNGISRVLLSKGKNDGKYDFSFYNYYESDGLQYSEFNIRSSIKCSSGEILMGGLKGFNYFNPKEIRYINILPHVSFVGFSLFNKDVLINKKYDGMTILKSAINKAKRVDLKYKQNVFSISFSSMNYILPKEVKYAYKLDGFDKSWIVVNGNIHKVTYTNLNEGTYRFRVKVANSKGIWNNKVSSLIIRIHPPFWRSIWAYIIYVILFGTLFYFIHYELMHREREKYKIKQLKIEAQHAHDMDEMKLRFFTSISHEFRTPIELILAPVENLLKQPFKKDVYNRLSMVRRNALRLKEMVDELLDFRKNDVQVTKLHLVREDVISFIRSICQSFLEIADKDNISLHFITSLSSLQMDFDEKKLNRIMINLLSNAFKFTNKGGKVEVFIERKSETFSQSEVLEIRVADTGIGISEEDKKHIFDRFYQGNNKNTESTGGTGIGLQLVKDFVEQHQGEIHVEDHIGGGSIFVFTLPLSLAEISRTTSVVQDNHSTAVDMVISDPTKEETGQDSIQLSSKHIGENAPLILIVDDNEDFCNLMIDSLSSLYRVEKAVNGVEAWTLIPNLQPDMVISDVMMPEMDGIQLARMMKTDIRTSHIPLILLTALSAVEQKIDGLETGADDYISKPFHMDVLILKIRKLLELTEKRHEQFNQQIDPSPSMIKITSLDQKLIAKAIKYVEDNMSRSDLTVEELSKELAMSRVYLYKKLTVITGKTPIEFIRVIRLKRAAQLLKESQLNVSQVAYKVGFNNPKYFSRYFKEQYNVSPSEYK